MHWTERICEVSVDFCSDFRDRALGTRLFNLSQAGAIAARLILNALAPIREMSDEAAADGALNDGVVGPVAILLDVELVFRYLVTYSLWQTFPRYYRFYDLNALAMTPETCGKTYRPIIQITQCLV